MLVRKATLVTRQIVEEVTRNKLDCISKQKPSRPRSLDFREFAILPADANRDALREKTQALNGQIAKVCEEVDGAFEKLLDTVSRSEDPISRKLTEFWDKPVEATTEEYERAKRRRERGNPPGKPINPLGDQISWEQLLSVAKSESAVWIATADKDYWTRFNDVHRLNPFLYNELCSAAGRKVDVYCFDTIAATLDHYMESNKVREPAKPTPDEVKKLIEEERVASLATYPWSGNTTIGSGLGFGVRYSTMNYLPTYVYPHPMVGGSGAKARTCSKCGASSFGGQVQLLGPNKGFGYKCGKCGHIDPA